ncbi:4'-phosphopantetheinyl transferase superfamily protein [Streptomyces sp. NPDC096012]|uniref:4'-phosphopantetheinyl transferase superfamily protein n=1 Tax=Streptomyces sp. NPDC096012 TaxID=3155684 RepID=UPI00336ADCD0
MLESVAVEAPGSVAAQHRAGRVAVGRALRRAGSPVTVVGRRRSGAPVGPDGFPASVTHTPEIAVAAVAPGVRGVGVDLEPRCPDPRLHRFLLDDRERASLWPDGDPAGLRRLFAAKEAAFKALTDCDRAHGGLFWRVRLYRHEGRLWARAGDRFALVEDLVTPLFAFAVAVGADPPPGLPDAWSRRRPGTVPGRPLQAITKSSVSPKN